MFTVRLDTSEWIKTSNAFNLFFSETHKAILLERLGLLVEARIIARTQAGLDAYGRQFKPYSRSWARVRSEKGLPTENVDLFFYGHLYAGLTHEYSSGEQKLFFSSSPSPPEIYGDIVSDKSPAEKALSISKHRTFFAVNDSDKEKAIEECNRTLEEFLNVH
jgi:hypothetical protein